jgi:probable F420-dependent oxidoreductase
MKLGVVLPQAEIATPLGGSLGTFATRVEQLGFDHLLAFEHILGVDATARQDWDGYYDHRVPFLEPMVLFGYLASICQLELVTDVMVLPQRQTALVAKQVATLDLLVQGRLRLGVGIGWNAVEYGGLGIDFGTRADRFEEQIDLLRRLWSEPSVDFAGRWDRIDRAGVCPLPERGSVPIWVGTGDAPRALRRVGRMADGWIPHPGLQLGGEVEKAWATVQAAAVDAGRPLDAVGLQAHIRVREHGLDQVGVQLARWCDLGATHVAIHTLDAGLEWPHGHLDVIGRVADLWIGH